MKSGLPKILATLLLTGCAVVGPDYQTPPSNLPAGHRTASAPASLPAEIDRWWTVLNDPVLNQYVDRALSENLDLAAADARIQQSRALAGTAAANQLPSAEGSGSASLRRDSQEASGDPTRASDDTYRQFSGQFDASWELDLFGGLRRARNAASRDLEAAYANRAATQVSLVAEIADTYVRLRALQQRLLQARANVAAQDDAVALSRSRFEAGLVSELDVAQAEALLADLNAVVPGLEADIEDRINQIALLAGMMPFEVGTDLREAGPIPRIPQTPGVGVPSDLLRRRPDIIEAERRLAAASERIGERISEYYPRVSLQGTLGLQSRDPSRFFTDEAGLFSAGPSVQWPLFDFARIDAEVALSRGVTQERLALYRAAILLAVSEVDTGIARLHSSLAEQSARERSVAAQVRALDIARAQYEQGLTQLLPVLDAQRRVHDAQDTLVRAKENRAAAAIALFKALGGGWTPPPLPVENTAAPGQ